MHRSKTVCLNRRPARWNYQSLLLGGVHSRQFRATTGFDHGFALDPRGKEVKT
jgi:hypothetical protein